MNSPSMLGYIYEQQDVLRFAFENRELYCAPMINIFASCNIKKVYFIGSGTSYNAAIGIKTYFERYLNVEAEVVIPTIFSNYTKVNNNSAYKNEEILVIGISQSGTSFSTVNAMKKAKSQGYRTIALTENEKSLIVKEVDVVIKLCVGKEMIPVETKGYTTTVITGYLWAVEIAFNLRLIGLDKYNDCINSTSNLINLYDVILKEVEEWYLWNSEELTQMDHGLIAAYGSNFCTALEGELKVYETFKQPIHAYELEELIHGPNMAFKNTTYIFIVASNEGEIERIKLFTDWFRENEITEHVFVLTTEDIEISRRDLRITTKVFNDLSQLVFTLPFQILAARNSLARGFDTSVRPEKRRAFAHEYKDL